MAGTKFGSGKKATVAKVTPSGSPSGNVPGNPGKVLPAKPIAGPGTKKSGRK